jgi:hypothetical protein
MLVWNMVCASLQCTCCGRCSCCKRRDKASPKGSDSPKPFELASISVGPAVPGEQGNDASGSRSASMQAADTAETDSLGDENVAIPPLQSAATQAETDSVQPLLGERKDGSAAKVAQAYPKVRNPGRLATTVTNFPECIDGFRRKLWPQGTPEDLKGPWYAKRRRRGPSGFYQIQVDGQDRAERGESSSLKENMVPDEEAQGLADV